MNPFALHGTDFLAFYAVLGVVALAVQFAWTRLMEASGTMPQLQMTDPYQIAYLRGGKAEALRVAAFSLIDRGLLSAGSRILASESGAEKMVRRPIEKAVLRLYRSPGSARALQSDSRAAEACREYRDTLEDFGLVAGGRTFARRFAPFLLAAMAVVFVGVLKIFIALAENRHNIGFTIILMIALCVVAILIFRRHRTQRGDAMMADLRMMFARLRERADMLRQGGATNEAALLAAVYGISELSPSRFPGISSLKPEKNTGSNCSSSCNSGYTSSCSSSCSGGGSSCGGGCGGGCGG